MKKIISWTLCILFFLTACSVMGVGQHTEDAVEGDVTQDYSMCLSRIIVDTENVTQITLPEPTYQLPTEFDWRNYEGEDWTTPIRNQGQCGSCWAFGAMGALEAAINIEYGDPDVDMDLSEQYLVSCIPNMGCNGGDAYASFRYLDLHGGALPEYCFPYQAQDIACEEKCEDWDNYLLPLDEYWVTIEQSIEAIKNALIEYGPLVADMAVYDDLQRYHGGVYEHPQRTSESVEDINHQPIIVGYNDDEECWIMKNSWGTAWGEDTYGVTGQWGWFRIHYGDCFIGYRIHGVRSDLVAGEDTGKPEIEITKPLSGLWYVNDEAKNPVLFGRTKIIGTLTVSADAWDVAIEDEETSGINRVEFFLDGASKHVATEEPYTWDFQSRFGFHEIRVIAYDNAGNPSESDTTVKVFVFF